jgi:hypothetical protein
MPPDGDQDDTGPGARTCTATAERTGAADRPAETAAGDIRLRVERHLAELSKRMEPEAFALFLRIVGGLGRAFGRHNRHVDIDLTPAERALYTPEFQQEITRLLEKADFPASRIVAGSTGEAGPDRGGDTRPRREQGWSGRPSAVLRTAFRG